MHCLTQKNELCLRNSKLNGSIKGDFGLRNFDSSEDLIISHETQYRPIIRVQPLGAYFWLSASAKSHDLFNYFPSNIISSCEELKTTSIFFN